MKYLIASDIHGSEFYCKKLIEQFRSHCADKLILLGDILYHGPRNDLPFGYEPKEVANMLNEIAGDVICIRGNCDCEVDQMMLRFPIMAEFAIIPYGRKTIFLTHGHKYGAEMIERYYKNMAAYQNGETKVMPDPIPAIGKGDVLVQGHTHQSAYYTMECGVINVNPGSVSIAKTGDTRGYMTFEDGVFVRYDIDGIEEMRYVLKLDSDSNEESANAPVSEADASDE